MFYWADELRWVGRDCRDSLLCGVVEGWLLFYWADELKKLGLDWRVPLLRRATAAGPLRVPSAVGLSPHSPEASKRLSQASLRRLFDASGLPGSMLEHVFNKYPIPSGTVLYKYMGHSSHQFSILYNWASAHSLYDSAGQV